MKLALLTAVVLLPAGCRQDDEPAPRQEEGPECTASVIFQEIIVTRETDPAPTDDTWEIEAQVIPRFPPNPGAYTKIVDNVAGNQGARLLAAPFTFGPQVLGPKDRPYDITILVRGREIDPPQENRGQDDVTVMEQQLEIRNMRCPNDADALYKFKQLFLDPAGGEIGQVEYTVRIDLDP